MLHWCEHGVRIFRVDNPHTKPLGFWEWLIGDRARRAPRGGLPGRGVHDAPPMMYDLGKVGFSQSYTYFTWRNSESMS